MPFMSRAKGAFSQMWQKALAVRERAVAVWRCRPRLVRADKKPGIADGAVSKRVTAGGDRAPVIAAGLSFLWPGLGHFFLGRRREAAILAVPAILLLILAVIQVSQGAVMFAASLWDESYFLAVAGAVIVFGAWRIVAVGHAFLSTSPQPRSRPRQMAFVAALVVVIVATHGLFVAGTWAWYETSVSIQDNNFVADATREPAPPTPSATPTEGSSLPPATAMPTEQPSPTRLKNPNRITFLLVGLDMMAGRDHSATDTMMLVSIDTGTEKVAMVSVPRDTTKFDLYYGGTVGPTFKLNSLWTTAMRADWKGPDEPMKTLENEIGFLVGIPVDYYAALDMDGFAKMVDAVGGIDIVNQRAINDPATGIVMAAGPVHLDGPTATLWVRSREGAGGSDYQRAGRQQAILLALEHKIASPSGLSRLGSLLSLAGKTVATDFPLNTVRNYVSAAQHVSVIEGCVLGPPYSYHPDTSSTGGTWTSRLDMARVANLSVELFGQESSYYGQSGVTPAACGK